MNLLDLPSEILRAIVQQYYEPWSIRLRKLGSPAATMWKPAVEGIPPNNLLLTCRELYLLAKETEHHTFTGELCIEESSTQMGIGCQSFICSTKSGEGLAWIRDNVKVIKFTNPGNNPAIWKFPHQFRLLPDFPALQRVELDCRYPYHFAVHNVDSMDDFLSNKEGRLDREMDYRLSFFLSCEQFLHRTICNGVTVRVIRAMGVREGKGKCQAVAVAVNYIEGKQGQLVLDSDSLETSSAPINGWPHNIRSTAESLAI